MSLEGRHRCLGGLSPCYIWQRCFVKILILFNEVIEVLEMANMSPWRYQSVHVTSELKLFIYLFLQLLSEIAILRVYEFFLSLCLHLKYVFGLLLGEEFVGVVVILYRFVDA